MIDLHTHSSYSDGTFTPGKLIASAKRENISLIALTDHDTIGGLDEAERYARDAGIGFVPGVELEIEFHKGEFHLLGLGLRRNRDEFEKALARVRRHRHERNVAIIGKMREAGIDITLDEVEQAAEGKIIARPHFARVMLRKKITKSIDEAFDKYLEKGRPFYAPKKTLALGEAIELINASGGKSVIAHPFSLMLSWSELLAYFLEAQKQGLAGIEAYHPQHEPATCRKLERFAREHGFIVSGGSDFHGDNSPGIRLGYVARNKPIPDSLGEEFRQ